MMSVETLRRARALVALLGIVLAGLLVVSCGGDQKASTAGPPSTTTRDTPTTTAPSPPCDPEITEPLAPGSSQHVLPGAPPPRYLSDPPTSGPHGVGNFPTGVVSEPILRPVQVGMLEGGAVLLQHRDLSAQERSALEALAGGKVTVAPHPELPERVVATAWTRKLVCRSVDIEALRRFATAYADNVGGH